MASYRDTVNDDYGRPIPGVLIYVFDKSGALATLDNGQANPITTDVLGSFAFSVVDGVYALEFRFAGVTRRQDNVIIGNPAEYKGETGDTGPANSTYDSKAAVAAAPASNKSYLLASSPFDGGYFQDLRGDYRTQVAADPNQVLFIPVAGDPTGAQGVRARVFSGPVDARWAKATGDGVTNDTAAIVAADRVAAAFGKELFIPAGTYMIDPITATTNWRMERGTIIKYRGNGTGYIPLVTFENMTDPVVEGGPILQKSFKNC